MPNDSATILYWWEDMTPGRCFEAGPRSVSEEEIVRFAREYDPQYYHTDPVAAKDSPFGCLISSGWMSCGIAMRMMCDSYLMRSACIGSPGLDGLRWLKPVRAGDMLRMRSTVQEQTASSKVPTRGTVRFLLELINQNDEVVLTMQGRQLFTRRQPAH